MPYGTRSDYTLGELHSKVQEASVITRRLAEQTAELNGVVAANLRLREKYEVMKSADKSRETAQLLEEKRMQLFDYCPEKHLNYLEK